MESLGNKVVIVTGGGMGLGEALCEEMASRGAMVVVADINQEAAERVASSIVRKGLRGTAVVVDVSREAEVQQMIDTTVSRCGRLDYIFNNAAIAIGGDARDISLEQWERVLKINLHGVVYGTIHAYQVMAKQGFGHIVNISSASGLTPQPGNAPYCTCKHGIIGLSLSLRFEGVDLGVKVSAVCPGDMKTSMYENMIVMNATRERVVEISRRSHFPIPQISARDAAQRILRGVSRNQALIVFPASVRWIWRVSRLFPSLMYRASLYRMRMFRNLLNLGNPRASAPTP
ncbi:MAG TPA: SDR family oxidoreductase [Candidatus Binataceae bacterium]|nr:SDR family oxidoreductase [Candidatus Binataceae bacterium]